MRHAARLSPPPATVHGATAPEPKRSDWSTLARLLPYLWQYKWRVAVALAFMVGAKLANVGVPLLLKELVDGLSPNGGRNLAQASGSEVLQAVLVVPVALLFGYGLLRLSTTLFTELRELVFAKATEGAARSISLQVFRHLHALSLRFHLDRQTGGMTRDIERGTRGVHSLISYSLYSIGAASWPTGSCACAAGIVGTTSCWPSVASGGGSAPRAVPGACRRLRRIW